MCDENIKYEIPIVPSHTIFVPIILVRGGLGSMFTGANTLKTDLLFCYDYQHMPHQPRTMFDWGSGRKMEFFWDANGNLAQMIDCNQNSGRLHEWDVKRNSRTEKSPVDSSRSKFGARVCQSKHRTQLDRLRFVLGDTHAGYYGYDANGDRVYKLTGESSRWYHKIR